MTTIMQSQIFFFISSVGFIILGILVGVVLIYLLRAINLFSKTLEKLEKNIDSVGDITKEMLEEIEDSNVFRFLFKKKRKHKKNY
jgi:uncharacterized protein YoxC